ncbi:sulfatase-like hydrolase/transferase, partial [Persicitalea sp.]|uniref:sulfatase-like hydrolase/transferase n=1 Tax=Persicitalea sp. TaxID=3100273 RepID=UPI003593A7D7
MNYEILLSRRAVLAVALFCGSFCFAEAQTTDQHQRLAPAAADRPNILWIVSEDNSPLIGAYGDKFATTPNIDKLATQGVLYTNAFATAPVCAPSRSTLITGMYPPSIGTENMRSDYAIPGFVKFYPKYLREAGYYTSNNVKKDYNVAEDQENAWDESSGKATYENRKPGQPFFAIFNTTISHESCIHNSIPTAELRHRPDKVTLPPYHPDTPEMRHDWAQYYDKVEDMDTFVGKVLADLEKSGEA